MVIKLRARSPEDKQARHARLLATARTLWRESDLDGFTMAGVAARAGIVKGTLYLYFQTKEALLLAVLSQELAEWFDVLDAALVREAAWDAARLARIVADSLADRASLVRLLTVQSSILERNIDFAVALAFKGFLLERAARAGTHIERALPWLAPGDGMLILQRINALVVGLAHLADPPPIVREVLERPEFAPLRVPFGAQLQDSLEALLLGIEQRRSP